MDAEAVSRLMGRCRGRDPYHKYRVVLGGLILSIDRDGLLGDDLDAQVLVVMRACVADALALASSRELSRSPCDARRPARARR